MSVAELGLDHWFVDAQGSTLTTKLPPVFVIPPLPEQLECRKKEQIHVRGSCNLRCKNKNSFYVKYLNYVKSF